MKRYLWIGVITAAMWLPAVPALAQTRGLSPVTGLATITSATTSGAATNLLGTSVDTHKIEWNVEGTVSGCAVALEQSADGTTWTDMISAQTCTSNGYAFGSGVANRVRVNATTFAGTGTLYVRYSGFVMAAKVDHCSDPSATFGRTAISTAVSATIVAGTASNYTYVCGMELIADAAVDVSVLSGTGTLCATGTTAMIGSTTATDGLALAANGGWIIPHTGKNQNWSGAAGDDVCIALGSGVGVRGYIVWSKSTRAP